MKRMGIILVTVFLLTTFGFGGEKTFSLLVSGGMTRLAPNDFNSFLQDYARYDFSFAGLTGAAGRSDPPKTLRSSTEFELALLFCAAPNLYLTFGSGFISAGLDSDPLLQSYGDFEVRLSRNDRIRSIPVRIGLLYSWILSRRLSLGPHVSLDAYISSFKETGYEERTNLEMNQRLAHDEWDIQTTAFSWGSTWGFSLDFSLSTTVSLFLDGGYRRARLSGFQGTETRFDNGIIESERDFRLLYYEFYSDGVGSGQKFLNLPMASGSTQLDLVRDAVLDLSGPYLKAGLAISF